MDFAPELPIAVAPLVVAYGMGVDSTALLVGLYKRGIRPDLILFADTGDEKQQTYDYLPIIQEWLSRVGFPPVIVVKNPRPVSKDKSLSDSLLRLNQLPALAFGFHQCSIVWKIDPQHKYIKKWQPAKDAWAAGLKVITAVGYDAGPRDSCRQYKAEGKARDGFENWFPLIQWGWDRERCEEEIRSVGLPVPIKSACFHCPASKDWEIEFLRDNAPEQFAKAVQMETQAIESGNLTEVKGLGRSYAWRDRYALPTPSAA